jgi:PAS domain S-box-containing protein
MGDSLFLINPGGQIMVSNSAASKLFGYTSSELEGQALSSLIEDGGTTEALLSDDPLRSYEAKFRTREGRIVPVSVSKSIIRTKRGNPAGRILIVRDVTEREEMEGRLSEAQRLAAIGETTTMVGHDLRNPLQAIVGEVYLARKELKKSNSPESQALLESFQQIETSTKYMNKIVSDLQEYAGPIRVKASGASMLLVVHAALSSLHIPSSIRVANLVHQDLVAEFDPTLMRRVISNLVLNAIQAMPQGGDLTISAAKVKQVVSVSVKDTGIGIPPEDMNSLFTPLFTRKAQGQGFGLAVAKRIVEAHGGRIDVDSQVGHGSTFTITLP